ncbi:UDP-N-acetylglucosamine--N-acetylmuramyl-(pentapeptide) pyrophosphoryl-undecaprenol N-acetylglucosamine transferase [Bacteriovoracaceae bacterium]|nr:UDP-N-acetylglucosamine--N-acetylmuramyl-(pentapeptide) pyrophosphoryl-undecaprenol N-acetylglucosamine transferase [Bacteriovoracaceae bacterium]
MNKVRKIFFSGGGSGGHVMPALTLIDFLKKNNPEIEIHYIGDSKGIEYELVNSRGVAFHSIHTGKLRRYFSLQNFIDFFKVILGIFEAFFTLLSHPQSIVFCTGGFVTVPVVIAAFLQGKKVYIHEQTSRVGLANKISSYFATRVFISFEESHQYFPKDKTSFTGYPIREDFFNDTSETSESLSTSFQFVDASKPLLFVTGGGNGSQLINENIKENLDSLKKDFNIVHQVGKNFEKEYSEFNDGSYYSAGFFDKEIIDLLKCSKVIVSRSGAGTVMELLALGKRSVLIPLAIAQKNEQYYNALEAKEKMGSLLIEEKNLTSEKLFSSIKLLKEESRDTKVANTEATSKIIKEIL